MHVVEEWSELNGVIDGLVRFHLGVVWGRLRRSRRYLAKKSCLARWLEARDRVSRRSLLFGRSFRIICKHTEPKIERFRYGGDEWRRFFGLGCFALKAVGGHERRVGRSRRMTRVSVESRILRHGRSIQMIWCGIDQRLVKFRVDGGEFTPSADRAFTA